MTGPLLAIAAFLLMEPVSYATHRWVMHGVGMVWHASHHAPPAGRFERNDWFPVVFSTVGIALFALASSGPRIGELAWIGGGVTAYGLCYLAVHEIYIHRRVGRTVRLPDNRYLERVRAAHRAHHDTGAESYGMLLPLRPRARQVDPADPERQVEVDPLVRRHDTRSTRPRLNR